MTWPAAVGLAILLFWQAAAPAQTATISGKTVGRTGDTMPGVIITLEAAPPFEARQISARSDGTFRFADIPPGTYSLKFEAAGWITYTRPRLALTADQTFQTTVAMDSGPMDPNNPPLRAYPEPPPRPDPTFPLADGEVAVAVITTVGTFYIAVDTKRAPITAANFLKYVDAKLFDEGRFHRATRADNYTVQLPNRPMMNIIQGGINPARRTEGFPAIPLERTSVTGIKHATGVVSMARGTGADTATSDFFVLLDDQPSLDFGGLRFDDGQGGAAFGHVLSGLDVVRKIQQQPVDGQNLASPVKIWRIARLGSLR